MTRQYTNQDKERKEEMYGIIEELQTANASLSRRVKELEEENKKLIPDELIDQVIKELEFLWRTIGFKYQSKLVERLNAARAALNNKT